MKIGEKLEIVVSEPWDFTTSMGQNKVTGKICDKIDKNYTMKIEKDIYLFKSDEIFEIDSLKVQYMVMIRRHVNYDYRSYNIAYIPDDLVSNFYNFDIIENQLIPIIIGLVK